MGKARSVAIATMVTALILSGPTPASAADPVDVSPPVVSSTGLTDGQIVGGWRRIHPVWQDDVGVVKAQVVINGKMVREYRPGQWDDGLGLGMATLHNGSDADVTVRVFDAAGNRGEATTRVHVDVTLPRVAPSPPFESFVGGRVTITFPEMPSDVTQIVLWDDYGNREAARATAAPWTLTWDTAGFNGAKWMHYEVTDELGNVGIQYGFYAVDNAGPNVFGVKFPRVSGRVAGRSVIVASIDDRSPLDRVEWWVDGSLRSTFRQADQPNREAWFSWDTGKQNRTATLQIRAYDVEGNGSVSARSVVIDNAGPVIGSITPGERALVRGGEFRTTARIVDPSGLGETYLYAASPVTPYTMIASAGPDGLRRLDWTATDRLGNRTVARRTVIVDNTRPAVKVTKAPKSGAKVKGTVAVAASASDRNGVARVELLINGKVVAKDYRAGYRFSIKTGKYGKKFKVQIRAYDRAGNLTTTKARTWHR